jgi:probable rRNA maturation factor
MENFAVSSTVRTYPKLPYEEIKRDILGESYELSLVFVGEARARALNKKYRKKEYVPNVLSFPLAKKSGEIYITPSLADRESKKSNMSPRGYVGYLFIHGLLHLKGYDHGATMDTAEKRFITKYKFK